MFADSARQDGSGPRSVPEEPPSPEMARAVCERPSRPIDQIVSRGCVW